MNRKRWINIGSGLGALAVAAVAWMLLRPGVMPLDEKSLEKFQEANSRAVERLSAASRTESPAVINARAFREAVSALGHDPDKTLLHWMSPELQQEITAGDPKEIVARTRLVDSLLATALGDAVDEEAFARILEPYSPEVRRAASARRPRKRTAGGRPSRR